MACRTHLLTRGTSFSTVVQHSGCLVYSKQSVPPTPMWLSYQNIVSFPTYHATNALKGRRHHASRSATQHRRNFYTCFRFAQVSCSQQWPMLPRSFSRLYYSSAASPLGSATTLFRTLPTVPLHPAPEPKILNLYFVNHTLPTSLHAFMQKYVEDEFERGGEKEYRRVRKSGRAGQSAKTKKMRKTKKTSRDLCLCVSHPQNMYACHELCAFTLQLNPAIAS